jgi:hypothetical protein
VRTFPARARHTLIVALRLSALCLLVTAAPLSVAHAQARSDDALRSAGIRGDTIAVGSVVEIRTAFESIRGRLARPFVDAADDSLELRRCAGCASTTFATSAVKSLRVRIPQPRTAHAMKWMLGGALLGAGAGAIAGSGIRAPGGGSSAGLSAILFGGAGAVVGLGAGLVTPPGTAWIAIPLRRR